MNIVGREKEREILLDAYRSGDHELIAITGRRRVGKTYLVNETLGDYLCFKHVGLSPAEIEEAKKNNRAATALGLQLKHFRLSLLLAGMDDCPLPSDWLEAFHYLSKFLKGVGKGQRAVIFLDELPWMDTPKSFFMTAFEGFINSFANANRIMVVVCGSSSSWMLDRFIHARKGLYGRVTREIALSPLPLSDCRDFFKAKGVLLSPYDIAQAYMVFGGIPYYLNHIRRGLSLAQSVDEAFFRSNAPLSDELELMFKSAFDDSELSIKAVRALGKKRIGLTREEIASDIGIKDGKRLSDALKGLIDGGIAIKYRPLQEEESVLFYKLVDPFCAFYLQFVDGNDALDGAIFAKSAESRSVVAWRGLAFENLCFNHLGPIKAALGISGVATTASPFIKRGQRNEPGAQIDLVLNRRDNIVNLCEMKFVNDIYQADSKDETDLVRKEKVLSRFLNKRQIIHRVLVTTFGIGEGEYRHSYQSVITLEDLFKK